MSSSTIQIRSTPQNVLRKQKSCVDVFINKSQFHQHPAVSNIQQFHQHQQTSSKPKPLLQKQLSVDNLNLAIRQKNLISQNIHSIQQTHPILTENKTSKLNFRTSNIVRKSTQNIECQNKSKSNDNSKKGSKREPNSRNNLSIFLSPSPSSIQDIDSVTDNDIPCQQKNDLPIATSHQNGEKDKTLIEENDKPKEVVGGKEKSAAERRLLFQSNKMITNANSVINNYRPKLVRAMSAPISKVNESYARRRERIQIDKQDEILSDNSEETMQKQLAPTKTRKSKLHSKTTTNSSFRGCDIETLVSFISSSGSDSEREDTSLSSTVTTTVLKLDNISSSGKIRAPMLRKTGKSVSFQAIDALQDFQTSYREFPTIIRRGSIAPLAARIKSNRPPTAPPGSVFIKDSEHRNDVHKTSDQQTRESDNLNITRTLSNENITYIEFPEYVRSQKEKECWKLYQKFIHKGVNVSYDTILRGMLTPTELRVIEKQKKIDNEETNEFNGNTNDNNTNTNNNNNNSSNKEGKNDN